jgi:hypothetical protein
VHAGLRAAGRVARDSDAAGSLRAGEEKLAPGAISPYRESPAGRESSSCRSNHTCDAWSHAGVQIFFLKHGTDPMVFSFLIRILISAPRAVERCHLAFSVAEQESSLNTVCLEDFPLIAEQLRCWRACRASP